MKTLTTLLALSLSSASFSTTMNLHQGNLFEGVEEINGHRTGARCSIEIKSTKETKSQFHYFTVGMSIFHPLLKSSNKFSMVAPAKIDRESGSVYIASNRFSGEHRQGFKEYDYWLNLVKDGSPTSSAVTVVTLLTQNTYECMNLKQTK